MSAASRRAARRELEVAEAVGSERVRYRPRFTSMPDVVPIRMTDGTVVVPEAATRKKLPALLLRKLAQARKYVAGGVPMVVLSQTGGEAIACMPLLDLARLVGLRAPRDGEQLVLLGRQLEAA